VKYRFVVVWLCALWQDVTAHNSIDITKRKCFNWYSITDRRTTHVVFCTRTPAKPISSDFKEIRVLVWTWFSDKQICRTYTCTSQYHIRILAIIAKFVRWHNWICQFWRHNAFWTLIFQLFKKFQCYRSGINWCAKSRQTTVRALRTTKIPSEGIYYVLYAWRTCYRVPVPIAIYQYVYHMVPGSRLTLLLLYHTRESIARSTLHSAAHNACAVHRCLSTWIAMK
jgi:hypothetical protein